MNAITLARQASDRVSATSSFAVSIWDTQAKSGGRVRRQNIAGRARGVADRDRERARVNFCRMSSERRRAVRGGIAARPIRPWGVGRNVMLRVNVIP